MKTLTVILLTFLLSCSQSPLDKEKEKNRAASIFLPVADFFRSSSTPSDDAIAAANNAYKLAYIRALPLYDIADKPASEIKILSLDGVVESAEVPDDGKPVVKFYVATKTTSTLTASRLKGFGWTTKATTVPSGTRFASNLTSVSNINFSIAKYVEGTNGSPGKWVNYIVTTPEVTAGSDGVTTYTRSNAFSVPTNDNEGTITDNGDGSYTYKFSRNIFISKNFIGSTYGETRTTLYTRTSTLTAVSSTKQANLGDLTYNASLPHRVIVYLGTGNVRGTSSNNTNGTDAATGVTTANFDDGETLAYDFIPQTKMIKALQRDITNTTTCNVCHKLPEGSATQGSRTTRGLIFHGSGGRNDVRHCVMCHTDQLRASSDVNVIADTTTGVYSAPTPAEYYVLDGYNVVDFPVMVHKFHMSSGLTKSGNYFAVNSSYNFKTKAAAFITLADSKLCYNCHTTNKSAVNEDNWKTKPSRAACGSCHDGVNFANGLMFKSVKSGVTDITHGGGKQLDDSKCASCHTVSDVMKKHGL